ncbi:MAG: glutaredoxin family protein [Gammaproteobacteria bacterium]
MKKPLVTLYFRYNCHLCEDMLQHLRVLQQSQGFLLETIDVDLNNRLQERSGTLVPVLTAGDEELCHYYLDEVRLRDYLSSQSTKVL